MSTRATIFHLAEHEGPVIHVYEETAFMDCEPDERLELEIIDGCFRMTVGVPRELAQWILAGKEACTSHT